MKIFSRVQWKLTASFVTLIIVGLAGWRFDIWTKFLNGAFRNFKTISAIYAVVLISLSIIYFIAKRDSLKPSVTSYHILGPGGDLVLSGFTNWGAFYAPLAVLRFVILEPDKIELTSLSQQVAVGLPLAGTMFWSLRNTLNMARETFLAPESVAPAPASAPPAVGGATVNPIPAPMSITADASAPTATPMSSPGQAPAAGQRGSGEDSTRSV